MDAPVNRKIVELVHQAEAGAAAARSARALGASGRSLGG